MNTLISLLYIEQESRRRDYYRMSLICRGLEQHPIYVHDQFSDTIILVRTIEDCGDTQYIQHHGKQYMLYSDGEFLMFNGNDREE